ncbi:hypothetical protein QBC45DRAFT_429612 [Copromyces sp. CBS 386.78]|nr:hypothetical protein QBC45DRAFT_429612 [Copromyces sp. CBS 386.78]
MYFVGTCMLAAAKDIYGSEYQIFEVHAITSNSSMVLLFLVRHSIFEGLTEECENVIDEAAFLFRRRRIPAIFRSKQRETALATQIRQLKTNVALVEAILKLERANVTTINENEFENNSVSSGSSRTCIGSSHDSNSTIQPGNSTLVAELQLPANNGNNLLASQVHQARQIQDLAEQFRQRADSRPSSRVGYLSSIRSRVSLESFVTARTVQQDRPLFPISLRSSIDTLRPTPSRQSSSVISCHSVQEEEGIPHADQQTSHPPFSSLRRTLSRISILSTKTTSNASVQTFATACDYQESLDLRARSMVEHGTVPDMIPTSNDNHNTSALPPPLPRASVQIPPAPRKVSIAILNSSQQWIRVKRARLDPQLYVRTRQAARRQQGLLGGK